MKRKFENQASLIKTAFENKSSALKGQRYFSNQIGWSSTHGQFLSNIMRRKCNIPISRLVAISRALEIPLIQLRDSIIRDEVVHIEESIREQGGII